MIDIIYSENLQNHEHIVNNKKGYFEYPRKPNLLEVAVGNSDFMILPMSQIATFGMSLFLQNFLQLMSEKSMVIRKRESNQSNLLIKKIKLYEIYPLECLRFISVNYLLRKNKIKDNLFI